MAHSEVPLRMPGEDYLRFFQPRGFLDTYYRGDFPQQDDGKDFRHFLIKAHHQTFKSGRFKGQRLLEVGTGPNIISVLSASKYFPDITCSDYLQTCRDELNMWLRDDPGAFDFGPYMQYLSKMEGDSTPEDIASRLRSAVKAVLPCDVTQPNPLAPQSLEPFDVVVSSLVLESASKTKEEYCACLGNLASLVKSGGGLILIASLDCTMYTVGEETFHIVSTDENFIMDSLAKLGFANIEIKRRASNMEVTVADQSAFLYLTAKKA